MAKTRPVLLHRKSLRALPELAHIEELDSEPGISKNTHSPLMG